MATASTATASKASIALARASTASTATATASNATAWTATGTSSKASTAPARASTASTATATASNATAWTATGTASKASTRASTASTATATGTASKASTRASTAPATASNATAWTATATASKASTAPARASTASTATATASNATAWTATASTATAMPTATAAAEGLGRQRASPDHLPVPPRPRSRYQHRAAVRPHPKAVGTPPRPAPALRHAQAEHRPVLPPRPRARPARPYNGGPFAALLYLCAVLGVAVDSCGSLRAYGGLAAVVAALIIALVLRRPPRLAHQDNADGPRQILAAPARRIQPEQPRLAPTLTITGSILDAAQVAAAIRSFMADSTRPILAVSPPQADSSDSDGSGSSTSGDDINNLWYTPLHLMKAGDVCLIHPAFIQQLQEMDPWLTEAESLELLRRAFRDANTSDGFHRLSDIVEENQGIIYDGLHVLTDGSTGASIMTMKITAKLIQLIFLELDGQNWKSCQDVKKECCFQEVVRQSVEELIDVALSFSNTRWSAHHPLQMLTILDALVDVLCTIRELTFSSTESMHDVVAHVFYKMVVDLRGMLEGTTSTSDMHSIRESAIHPATALLVRYLEFFCRNGDMMQFVLGTEDFTIELSMIYAWVSKLSEDAEAMFPAKGQRYIYILNNMDFVYQLKNHPGGCLSSVELQTGLCSLIHQYIQSYLDECWVPLLGVDSLKRFLEEFFTICDSQMTWKVRTVHKVTLRREIVGLIVPNYVNFLQENCSSHRTSWLKARSEKPMYTAVWLEEKISGFFET
ncbi:hypothetical protein VPH35_025755 [Triticum aestivum]|uniref:Exocyst subunit Exo70 family protein n=2 Tax=Triticum TaxID=4564 RepID=A0A3B6BXU1_WHEAT|nr:uncharacterized protein LOC123043195 [Triticum aestivum]